MPSVSSPFSRTRARVHFTAPVTLSIGDLKLSYGGCYDVSMNGIFVRTAKPLPLGTEAHFSIHLSAGMRKEAMGGQCRVVRTVSLDDGLSGENPGPGMGLKFLEFDEDHDLILYQLIRHNGG